MSQLVLTGQRPEEDPEAPSSDAAEHYAARRDVLTPAGAQRTVALGSGPAHLTYYGPS